MACPASYRCRAAIIIHKSTPPQSCQKSKLVFQLLLQRNSTGQMFRVQQSNLKVSWYKVFYVYKTINNCRLSFHLLFFHALQQSDNSRMHETEQNGCAHLLLKTSLFGWLTVKLKEVQSNPIIIVKTQLTGCN